MEGFTEGQAAGSLVHLLTLQMSTTAETRDAVQFTAGQAKSEYKCVCKQAITPKKELMVGGKLSTPVNRVGKNMW